MENEFVPYEQALDLKELGFDEECFGDYFQVGHHEGQLITLYDEINNELNHIHECLAPIYQQAFRWFREKHNLHTEIYYHWGVPEKYGLNKNYILLNIWKKNTDSLSQVFEINKKGNYSKYASYQEVEFETIKKLIELVKSK